MHLKANRLANRINPYVI